MNPELKFCKFCASTSLFYPYNPYKCKACLSAYATKWQKDNRDRRVQQRIIYRDRNREHLATYYQEWYEGVDRKRYRDPLKVHAHNAVSNAVRKGELVRPDQCSECRRTIKIEGHHPDYTKPLDVLWLCNRCHRLLHPGARQTA